jgi:hypothetical protein
MLHKDYDCKGSVDAKIISGLQPQGIWRQERLAVNHQQNLSGINGSGGRLPESKKTQEAYL